MRATLLAVFLLAGCNEKNPNFCADGQDHLCEQVDAPAETCSATKACTTGVCKLPEGTCVGCLVNTDCMLAAPVCETSTNTCGKCTAHAQCDSKVCTPEGACALADNVAYVAQNGTDAGTCPPETPCRTVLFAVDRNKTYTKIVGDLDDAVVLDSKNAVIVADPTTKLTRVGGGTILEVRGTSNITIHGLRIADATTVSAVLLSSGTPTLKLIGAGVINNSGRGIVVSAGTLDVQRSLVAENAGGGIEVVTAQKVTIINNLVVNNGKASGTGQSTVGGINVAAVVDVAGSKLGFNTIAQNENSTGSVLPGGVACQVTGLDAGGNIVYSNTHGTTNDSTSQNAGGCTYGNTFASGPVAGNLGFDIVSDPPVYMLVSSSPPSVLDVGGTCPTEDFQNQARPFNNACDLGADEYRP